ncbi:MAG: type IX secretion system sortase PorU [Ignavibacteriae bacterium]|nr:type IX secretion system sortase PorU [Ignavibacteriota bacterium]
MKLSSIKRTSPVFVVLFAAILVMPSCLFGQSIFTGRGLEVIRSSASELVISYTPQFEKLDTILTSSGEQTIIPRIQGAAISQSNYGAPSLLTVSAPIAIPSPSDFTITNIQTIGVRRIAQKMSPAPTPYRNGEFHEAVYELRPELYQSAAPKDWATLTYGGIARNKYIADLSIIAARYDGVSQTVELPSKIIITIRFAGGVPVNKQGKDDYNVFQVLNNEQSKSWRINETSLAKLSDGNKILSAGKWVKITIESEGIYKIDAAMLSKYGINLTASDVSTIKVFGNGGVLMTEDGSQSLKNKMQEQPIIVRTKPNGELEAILFYASGPNGFEYKNNSFIHYTNPYSTTSSYLITVGGEAGLRASELEEPSTPIVNRPTSYTARLFNEEELTNAFIIPSGRTWFGRTVDNSLPQIFTTPLQNLVKNGEILYRYAVAHRSAKNGSFAITENGTTLDTVQIPGVNQNNNSSNYTESYSVVGSAKIPASAIATDNRSVLKFTYSNTGSSSASGLMDWFEIQYPRECIAINNEMEFLSDVTLNGGTEYSLNGFSGEIFGFDATNRAQPKMLKNFASTGGMFIVRSDLAAGTPKRFYISSTLKTPRLLETADVADLRSNFANTDVVVITHKSLLESAVKFKEYRESQKELSVSVVTTEQIFNEFSGGMTDVTAIRDFLAFAYTNWSNKPKYVLLWGDGHSDYKNIQTQETNFVPPYESEYYDGPFDETGTYTTDDYFARIAGNDRKVDMAISRIPIPTPEMGQWIVEKIKHYETESQQGEWQSTVTLVADDGLTTQTDDGTEHTQGSEDLSKYSIPEDMQQHKVYLAEYPVENVPNGRRKPAVTAQLLNEVNTNGSVLLSWVGHGSPRVWAHELIFERETTIPQMTNLNKLFFLTAATCDFARFDDGDHQSGAEELVFSKTGGAIGVFAASRPVFSYENKQIAALFYKFLFSRAADGKYLRLGDIMYNVKQERDSQNDEKYFLLGDPTMRLLFPENIVRIDAINGQKVTDSIPLMPLLKALSTVTIEGSIITPKSPAVDTSFNGTALISLDDSDIDARVEDVADGVVHSILKTGGTLNRSAYRVKNGLFKAEFVMPLDLSFTNKQGRLYAYAFSDKKTAKGDSRSFLVGGIIADVEHFNDKNGPAISIFLDDRSFQAGNLVRKSPLLLVDLFDSTGINTTGSSIGHKIEAWFDNEPAPLDLTPSFTTSLDDSRKGSTEKQIFNLAAGNHSVKVRAWDVLNNYSETQTNFRVASTDGRVITDNLQCYPNPSSNGTNITFQHNQSQPFTVAIHIFTVDGRMVKSIAQTIEGLHTASIAWDGLDALGAKVSQGSYVFTVDVQTILGDSEQLFGKISIVQ